MNPAEAALLFTLEEVGSDVVLSGSGTANLADLTFNNTFGQNANIAPVTSRFHVGFSGNIDAYRGITGPASFGSGNFVSADSSTGDLFGVYLGNELELPTGYTSGSFLSGTATFENTTIAALGATLGTYTWTWGSGANADFAELTVGSAAAVPEPMTILGTITALGFGAAFKRRQAKS